MKKMPGYTKYNSLQRSHDKNYCVEIPKRQVARMRLDELNEGARYHTSSYRSSTIDRFDSNYSQKEKRYNPVKKAFAIGLIAVIGALGAAKGIDWVKDSSRQKAIDAIALENNTVHRVKAGETIWGIADKATDGDVREEVWEIQNDPRNADTLADGVISPGEKLFVHSPDKQD